MGNVVISCPRERRQQFIEHLISLVKIPSILVDLGNFEDVITAADWNMKRLRELGFEDVEVIPVGDHQVVFGRFQGLVLCQMRMLCMSLRTKAKSRSELRGDCHGRCAPY